MTPCDPGTCEHERCEAHWLAALGLRTIDADTVERLAEDWRFRVWRQG